MGALVLRGDAMQLVDMGTGDFGGDHDSFTGLVRAVSGRTIPTPNILRLAREAYKRIKGTLGRRPLNLW